MSLLTAHKSTSIVPTRKTPLTHRVETITRFFMCKKKPQVFVFHLHPSSKPQARFCDQSPITFHCSSELQHIETSVTTRTAHSPRVGARAGEWGAVTQTKIRNIQNN